MGTTYAANPFAGVLKSEQVTSDLKVKPANPTTSRRGLFRPSCRRGCSSGTFGFLNASKGAGTVHNVMLGEEGGGRRATTFAVGEEGAAASVSPTFAVGEEGGGQRVTTDAVGEEGGGQRVTTYAVAKKAVCPP